MKHLLVVILVFMTHLHAQVYPGLDPVSTIDWSHFADELNFSFEPCMCKQQGAVATQAGWKLSLSEPIAIQDMSNNPWKFPSLDMNFDTSVTRSQGSSRDGGTGSMGLKYSHFIVYPIMSILGYTQDYVCFERASVINVVGMSEIMVTAKNDFLANARKPYLLLTNNMFAQSACIADCAAATTGHPINSMTWCAGCWYPINSDSIYIQSRQPIVESGTLAAKMLSYLHSVGGLTKTSEITFAYLPDSVFGKDSQSSDPKATNPANKTGTSFGSSLCQEVLFFDIPKEQYELQLSYPTVWDATSIGTYAPLWALFKNKVTTEDDVAFWLWRKRDMCAGPYKCRSTFGGLQ